ncbi:prolyl oligopeptidase family protein [Spongiibacter sp. IMCC21906]|uniref:alpha/beta hydrolase family protein n=1 Tax=Spongiibacter sp. IMCC21906 TaxID=1620392 RepID=UPI00062DCED7|nr:prolyl oligopeptidase family serine peptidase [Spongiibacter sp. IMCC21906]AKH68295.1 prolyl oligopeptidase family protein [Spongiibacter sp. IMCC21906]
MFVVRAVVLFFIAITFAHGDEAPIPPSIDSYAILPSIDDVALSISGQYMAMTSTVKGRRILVIAESSGKLLNSFGLGGIKVRSLFWAGDDYLIARTSSTQNLGFAYGGRYELGNLMVIQRGSGELSWPLHESGRVVNAAFGFQQPAQKNGKWYQCVGTLPLSRSSRSGEVWIGDDEVDLSCINLETGKLKILRKGRKNGDGWLLGPELEVLAHALNNTAQQRWVLKASNQADTIFSNATILAEGPSRYGHNVILGRGRTPGTILYSLADARGSHRLMESPLSGKGEAVELYADIDTTSLAFDPLTGFFSGYWAEGPVEELTMLDDKAQARVVGTRKAFPNSTVRFVSWSKGLDLIIVYTEGSDDSGTWWLVNIGEGSATPIGESYPGIKANQVGKFSLWHYTAQDGLAIEAIITEPASGTTENMPLIVMPHGGPQVKDRLHFDWMAQAFASRGYLVLQPNFRGSSGYGLGFRNAGFNEWGRKMQSDLSDGVAALVKEKRVDPNRVCIIGGSYGGYAALAGVTLQQGIYRCAVSIAGVSDPVAMLRELEVDRRRNSQRYWQDFMGAKNSRDDVLENISPLAHAKKADAPILLLHGEDDLVVPISHSTRMAKKLKRADKPYKFVKLKTEDHYLSREATRQQMLQEAMNFVMKHNPPS